MGIVIFLLKRWQNIFGDAGKIGQRREMTGGGWRFIIGEYLVTPGGENMYILLKSDISYAVVDLCGYLISRNRFGSH